MSTYLLGCEADNASSRTIKVNHQAAADGLHLPWLTELLCGCPFMYRDVARDAAAWTQETRSLWEALDGKTADVLDQMLATPTIAGFQSAGTQLQALTLGADAGELRLLAYRPFYYAASLGCLDSALQVAKVAAALSVATSMDPIEKRELTEAAVGWLLASRAAERPKGIFRRFRESPRVRAAKLGAANAAALGIEVTPQLSASEEDLPEWAPAKPCPSPGQRLVVVMASVGNPGTPAGQRISEELNAFAGRDFPVMRMPDLVAVETALTAEFPHLVDVIQTVLRGMHGRTSARFRPLLLVGNPGTGKTRLGMRLLERLSLSPLTYSCGGVADASIAGTSRRWETAAPSLPLARIMATGIANPGVLLDELEKTATSRHNGSTTDALLNLLEPQTSATWVDPYVEAAVDVSQVCWVATANSLQGLSKPLLDRFKVVRVPEPALKHLEALGNSLIKSVTAEQGLHMNWAMPLDGTELQALARIWQGGSVRRLARLISGVLDARDMPLGRSTRALG